MVWKCPPLHLYNWNNFWKWKTEMKYDQEIYEALAENERLHGCELYELRKGDKFKIIDDELNDFKVSKKKISKPNIIINNNSNEIKEKKIIKRIRIKKSNNNEI